MGASTHLIDALMQEIAKGKTIDAAIQEAPLPQKAKDFLAYTFEIAQHAPLHVKAAVFTFGREDLIPSMFTAILKNFQASFPETDLRKLIYYFERHIELDADEHGPMAMQMITELCGDSEQKWKEVELVSIEALEKRIGLWNAIEEQIVLKKELV